MATLSSKFQISIPEQLGLHAGQRFPILARGESIVLAPKRSLDGVRRRLHGCDTTSVRERQDRL